MVDLKEEREEVTSRATGVVIPIWVASELEPAKNINALGVCEDPFGQLSKLAGQTALAALLRSAQLRELWGWAPLQFFFWGICLRSTCDN